MKWQLKESVSKGDKIQHTQGLETLKESYRGKKNPTTFYGKNGTVYAMGNCVEQCANWKGSSGRTRKRVSAAGRISFQRCVLEKEVVRLFGHGLDVNNKLEELSPDCGLREESIYQLQSVCNTGRGELAVREI